MEWLRRLGEGFGPILDLTRMLSDPSPVFALLVKALFANPIGIAVLIASAIIGMMLLLVLLTAFYAARASRTAADVRRLHEVQDRLVGEVEDLKTTMTFVAPRLDEMSAMVRLLAQQRPYQLPPALPPSFASRLGAAVQLLLGR